MSVKVILDYPRHTHVATQPTAKHLLKLNISKVLTSTPPFAYYGYGIGLAMVKPMRTVNENSVR